MNKENQDEHTQQHFTTYSHHMKLMMQCQFVMTKHHVSTASYALIISEQSNWNFIFLQSNKYIYLGPEWQLVFSH